MIPVKTWMTVWGYCDQGMEDDWTSGCAANYISILLVTFQAKDAQIAALTAHASSLNDFIITLAQIISCLPVNGGGGWGGNNGGSGRRGSNNKHGSSLDIGGRSSNDKHGPSLKRRNIDGYCWLHEFVQELSQLEETISACERQVLPSKKGYEEDTTAIKKMGGLEFQAPKEQYTYVQQNQYKKHNW